MAELDELIETKKKIETALNALAISRDELAVATKRGEEKTGELEIKMDKLSEIVTAGMAAHAEQLNKIQAMAPKHDTELEILDGTVDLSQFSFTKKQGRDVRKEMKNFIKNGGNQQNFFEHLSNSKKLDILSMDPSMQESGGFMVLPQLLPAEKTREFETSPMSSLARVENISTGSIEFVIRDGAALTVTRVKSTGTRTVEGTKKTKKIKIEVFEKYVNSKLTQTQIDDQGVDTVSWIMEDAEQAFNLDEEEAYINGVDPDEARGILTYSNWTTPDTYQSDAIEQIASGHATLPTSDGLIDIQNSLKEVYQPNATWLMRRRMMKYIMNLKTGSGEYIFARDLSRNMGAPFTLLTAPVKFAADMPAFGAGSLSVAYGDFRKAYMIVRRFGTRVLRDPYTDNPFIVFKFTRRVGGAVYNFEAFKILKTCTAL